MADFKKDIDGVIKGEVRLWTVAMQTYCERLMKLFNNKEKIYIDDEKITLGSCLNDSYFKEKFQEKTGFQDFNSLRRLNNYGNTRKHNTSNDAIEKKEIKEWLRRIHTLSIKTYNYLNDQNYQEDFNEKEVDKLLLTIEEEFFDVIDYADNIINRKNEVILNLESEYQDLVAIIKDDTEVILEYKKMINKLKRANIKKNKIIMNYKILYNMFEEYIDLNRLKNYCVDDIMGNIIKSDHKFDEQLNLLNNELQELKTDIKQLLKNIETFDSTYINRSEDTQNESNSNNINVANSITGRGYMEKVNNYELNDDEYTHNLYLDYKEINENVYHDYEDYICDYSENQHDY